MTILVTGGTGLVGRRLLPRLVEAGVDCRSLVRAGKNALPGAASIEGDILDRPSLTAAVAGVDAVLHFAAVLRNADAAEIWAVNREGTRNLIAAVKDHAPDARFIMASTGLVYGEQGERPSLESDEIAPKRDYPSSKAAAEKLLRESGLTWSILRLGFVYGDGDGHLQQVPHIAQRLKLHPANRLSMIHHRDIVTFVRMALAGAFDGLTVNAVDDAPMTILELSEIAGAPMAPTAAALVNPWSGVLDGSLAQRLGFKPQIATTRQAARERIL